MNVGSSSKFTIITATTAQLCILIQTSFVTDNNEHWLGLTLEDLTWNEINQRTVYQVNSHVATGFT